jgi:putative ABC transport system permease protein
VKHPSALAAGLRRFARRLVSTIRPGAAAEQDRQLDRELAAHLAMLEARFLREGMAPAAARAAAARALGGVTQLRERHRDARTLPWVEDARADAAYAIRSLSRSGAFAVAAIATLAIGIGAATTISSVVDVILLKPLPFPDADRLVSIGEIGRPRTLPGINYREYTEWRTREGTLSGLATSSFSPRMMLRTPVGTVRVTGGEVSPNYFEVLGVRAALGRTIASSDEADPSVAVLSHDAWQKLFAGEPSAVGTVVFDTSRATEPRALTIVGVMPQGMEQLGMPHDLYVPVVARGPVPPGISSLVGRMRDGVSLAAAAAEANALGMAIRPPRPPDAPPLAGPRFAVRSLKDDVVSSLGPVLRVFVAAVAIVLAIVCANVANLLLARGSARRQEMAVRLALGAGRGRIVRQVLAECLVLALAGGALGAVLAAFGVSLVRRLATIETEGVFRLIFREHVLPRVAEIGVDARLLLTALVLGVASSVLFGILPALQVSDMGQIHASGTRGASTSRRDTRARAALVVVQMAMATVLLVGAALLGSSFFNLATVNKGYEPDHTLVFQVAIPEEYSPTRKGEVVEAVLARARALPGAGAVGFAYAGLMVGVQDTLGSFVPPDRTLADVSQDRARPRLKALSPGYLEAIGARVLDGRLLTDDDLRAAEPAVVVNRTVARRYFGVVGSHFDWHVGKSAPIRVAIVGIVEDIRQARLEQEPYAEVFMDYRQLIALGPRLDLSPQQVSNLAFGFMSFAMRTAGDPRRLIGPVREATGAADPRVGIDAILPMSHLVSTSVARQRFYAAMLGIFAAVAALLAALGAYGVLAYAVARRTREIGIRVALGAGRANVLGLVLRHGLLMAGIGIASGSVAAALATRSLRTMLFGIAPLDARAFAAVAVGFFAVALLASYLPARRAAGVDPVVALRAE